MVKLKIQCTILFTLMILVSSFIINISEFGNGLYVSVSKTDTEFAGGDGTAFNPYKISNITQLQYMNANLTAHYIIVNDIDASTTANWNNGSGFDPIGNNITHFKGSLNGNNHIISNLIINRSSELNVGLFGYLSSGLINDVTIININLTGYIFAGGIAGINIDSNITNCYSQGIIVGKHSIGGLIGANGGSVTNCGAKGNISGNQYVGGLIGHNSNTNITDSYYHGDIIGNKMVGGLVGINFGGTFSRCNSSVNVKSNDNVGGLVGENYGGFFSGCYSSANLSGEYNVGGMVGYNSYGNVSNCSSLVRISGQGRIGGLVGINLILLCHKTIYLLPQYIHGPLLRIERAHDLRIEVMDVIVCLSGRIGRTPWSETSG